jgi:hypothetical protein
MQVGVSYDWTEICAGALKHRKIPMSRLDATLEEMSGFDFTIARFTVNEGKVCGIRIEPVFGYKWKVCLRIGELLRETFGIESF